MAFLGRKSGRAALISADIPSNLTLLGSHVKIPSVTTANRPGESGGDNASITPVDGMLLYNSTLNVLQQRADGVWQSVSSPPTLTSITPSEVESAAGGNVTFTIAGTGFLTGDAITFIANSGSDITSGIATTYNSSIQLTVVVAKNLFVEANEPYDVKITSVGGLIATLADAVRVDNSPSWATYVGTLSGTPPVVATVVDTAVSANHATLSAVDPESDTIAYTETTSILTTAGMSLASATGIISGTPTGVSSDTNYDFTARATSTGDGGASVKTTDQAFRFVIQNYVAPTGGNNVTTYGGYTYHTFTADGDFVVTAALNIDFIIVGGGGGGGRMDAGGGGGGGLVIGTAHPIAAGTFAIDIGPGGLASTYNQSSLGNAGTDSTGFGFTAKGGGYGGSYIVSPYTGYTGGSGGGGAGRNESDGPHAGGVSNQDVYSGTSTVLGKGNAGGTGSGDPSHAGGGGGGAGETGRAYNATGEKRYGGDGFQVSWTTVYNLTGSGDTSTGLYWAGGGGGCSYSTSIAAGNGGLGGGGGGGNGDTGGAGSGGTGGLAVGGAGGSHLSGSGAANTGGGGGGVAQGVTGSTVVGGGGSGIVVIRYAV